MFEKLDEAKKKEILAEAYLYVKNAENLSKKNFKNLSEFFQNNGKKFLEETLFSVDYVMANKDRYALMSSIARKFEFGKDYDDMFAQEYYDNLIKPRNDLAHNKLYYGACKKKLHIAKKREQSACDTICAECKSKYDVVKCKKIRSDIFKYFLMLSDLYKNIEDKNDSNRS